MLNLFLFRKYSMNYHRKWEESLQMLTFDKLYRVLRVLTFLLKKWLQQLSKPLQLLRVHTYVFVDFSEKIYIFAKINSQKSTNFFYSNIYNYLLWLYITPRVCVYIGRLMSLHPVYACIYPPSLIRNPWWSLCFHFSWRMLEILPLSGFKNPFRHTWMT